MPAASSPEVAAVEAALREWRRERSRSDGVPAYVVINDRHLMGIAERRPTDTRALAACPGIGPAKLAAYGDELVAFVVESGEGEVSRLGSPADEGLGDELGLALVMEVLHDAEEGAGVGAVGKGAAVLLALEDRDGVDDDVT